MNNDKTRILLFDGVCNLCTGIAQFTGNRDSKGIFRLDTLQSEYGQLLLKQFDLPSNDFKSIVYIEDDMYFLRSTAVLHVLKELGGLWKLFYCLIIFPLPWRDFIYNLIAKTRYKIFGKRVTCMIPDLSQDKVIPEKNKCI
jgi:predicted DCC family thiol-disulfide oxidoreductase YuxK